MSNSGANFEEIVGKSTSVANKLNNLPIHATLTATATLVAGEFTPVNVEAGGFIVKLPTGKSLGTLIAVEKTDATANIVTVEGSIRGEAITNTLKLKREAIVYEAETSGSWRPIADHKTLGSLDARYEAKIAESISGLVGHENVYLASTEALPANTYLTGVLTGGAFGALTIDSIAVPVGKRIIVKNEINEANNGIYVVTHAGGVAEAYVLTRVSDMNTGAGVEKAYAFVEIGTKNKNSGWFVSAPGPFTIGTTAIPWSRLPGTGDLVAGEGINITGDVIAVSPSVVSESRESAQALISALSAVYLADSDDEHILANTSTLAPAANWTKAGAVGDSGTALYAGFTAAVAAEVADPSEASSVKRGRKAIRLPAGAFYTQQPGALMNAGGNRTFGLKYRGAGRNLTQVYFQPKVGKPRTLEVEVNGAEVTLLSGENFTAEDKGHLFDIYQAGPGGGVLRAVITTYTSPTKVLIGLNAVTNVSGVTAVVSPEAPLFYNSDKHANVDIRDLEFVGLQPTEAIPPTTVSDAALGITVTDGAMGIGSTVLTSAKGLFTPDMIGLTVTVEGGGAGKTVLTTKITAFNTVGSVSLENANTSGEVLAAKSVSVLSNILQLGRVLTDAAMTATEKKLKSETANFTAADLGTTIGVAGAGVAGALLYTTVQKIVSTKEVLVAQECLTTVAGATLTMGGKTITGKYIGNPVEVEGAGVAGAMLTATVCAIRLRDVNGVPSTAVKLSAPCATVVTTSKASFACDKNAVLWRATSNGGIVGPIWDARFAGAWSSVMLLDGTNQNADIYFEKGCEGVNRPGTFLHLLSDPALTNANDQQLDFKFDAGIWAFTYGDVVFFDGRGGYIKMCDGSQTIGEVFAITEDAGGKLPVAITGGSNDPGGTWFKLRDRSGIQNHRVLVLDKTRFEERNNHCCIWDIEWSCGHIMVNGSTDDNEPPEPTSANTFFTRTGFLGETGPSVTYQNCTWKGRHLIRYKNAGWKFPHSVYYKNCVLKQQASTTQFIAAFPVDNGTSGEGCKPVIHFEGETKTSTAQTSLTAYQDSADNDLFWQEAGKATLQTRWRKMPAGANTKGILKTGETMTLLVPFNVLIVQLHLWVPVVAGASENTDWTVTITDSTPTTIHTFKEGVDGIAATTKWGKEVIHAMVTLAAPFLTVSINNRTLLAKVGGTGTTANLSAYLAVGTIG